MSRKLRNIFSRSPPRSHPDLLPTTTSKPLPVDDEPPPYTAAPSAPPPAQGLARRATLEQEPDYSPLRAYDTVIVIDDSGSMAGSNWTQTATALSGLVPTLTEHDANGVDVYFLNNPRVAQNMRSSRQVMQLFSETRPGGATPTGKRLGGILRAYLAEYKAAPARRKPKPLNVIVITDGSPTDPYLLETEILQCARELDRLSAPERQVGIQFFQVGNDEGAAEALEELDNALSEENETRDMVDTVSYRSVVGRNGTGFGEAGLTAEGVLKIVLGAVDKSLDRKRLRRRRL